MNDALTLGNPASSCPPFFYRAYGLTFASAIEMRELAAANTASSANADAEIVEAACASLSATRDELADGICVRGRTAQFVAEGVARYTMEAGRRIVVERMPPDTEHPLQCQADVRLFALGSAMGALLYQRSIIPLHASAVATPQGTWAFTGASGAGKSTLATWLSLHWGQPLVTDDVLAAHLQDDSYQFYPGPARVKLWADALDALGMSREGLARDYSRADKFQVPMRNLNEGPCSSIRGLVLLERGADDEPPTLTAITGVEAFQAMLSSLYRPSFAFRIIGQKELFEHCMRLATQIPCYRFRRSPSLGNMEATLEPLLRKIGSSNRPDVESPRD